MSEATARSPVALVAPVGAMGGWHVSRRRSTAPLTLADWTPLAKVLIRTSPRGPVAQALRVECGRARRATSGTLIIRPGPDEWLLLGPPGDAPGLVAQWEGVHGDDLTTVVDITSGRALLRLSGARASDVLAKLCAVDATPVPMAPPSVAPWPAWSPRSSGTTEIGRSGPTSWPLTGRSASTSSMPWPTRGASSVSAHGFFGDELS